ncbi:uncharacterized protein B0H64DRAFT_79077 [Chaetomium fimeti]|uniref:Uncharacterized protein n=1 Tax=Chaetomium fimeti TaxID=1854472 RepID=A0AAE0HLV0_9PEZI|nr:hypothetical protein B0H64DRAFT_79077 [Chaetomium fimeti]
MERNGRKLKKGALLWLKWVETSVRGRPSCTTKQSASRYLGPLGSGIGLLPAGYIPSDGHSGDGSRPGGERRHCPLKLQNCDITWQADCKLHLRHRLINRQGSIKTMADRRGQRSEKSSLCTGRQMPPKMTPTLDTIDNLRTSHWRNARRPGLATRNKGKVGFPGPCVIWFRRKARSCPVGTRQCMSRKRARLVGSGYFAAQIAVVCGSGSLPEIAVRRSVGRDLSRDWLGRLAGMSRYGGARALGEESGMAGGQTLTTVAPDQACRAHGQG